MVRHRFLKSNRTENRDKKERGKWGETLKYSHVFVRYLLPIYYSQYMKEAQMFQFLDKANLETSVEETLEFKPTSTLQARMLPC